MPVSCRTHRLPEEDNQNNDGQNVRRNLQVNGWQAGDARDLVADDTQALSKAKEEG